MAVSNWRAFSGFELNHGDGKKLRLAARDVATKLEIVIDDHPAAEPQRWRLTEEGAKMFSAANIQMLVTMGYAQRVD